MTRNRAKVLVLSVMGVAAIAWASVGEFAPRVVYNASSSLPIGFYRVTSIDGLRYGDLVVVPVPERYRSLASERRYLAPGVALIKRVIALPGDHVCSLNGTVSINGRPVAQASKVDSAGRQMPIWVGCRTLNEGKFFALIGEVKASFDSRYLGPLSIDSVIGRAQPLWLFAGPSIRFPMMNGNRNATD